VLEALLDTNQLVSSLLSAQGPQAQMIDAWRQRVFVLGMVPGQVEEVAEVLSRPKIARKYRILAADRQALLQLLRSEAILLPVEPAPGVCRGHTTYRARLGRRPPQEPAPGAVGTATVLRIAKRSFAYGSAEHASNGDGNAVQPERRTAARTVRRQRVRPSLKVQGGVQ
jgi:hypothetical protein